jgi:succinate dehydrogenase / fumarate reductase cytochrome b subunit
LVIKRSDFTLAFIIIIDFKIKMAKSVITTSSVGRKVLMALSGFFLMFFLLQHLAINMLSVISPDMFNEVSYFMGNNPLIQFAMQPLLLFGVFFHFIMGFYLDFKNRGARNVKYAYNKPNENSSWMSRNMIWSGGFLLLFFIVHFKDFWIPEITEKYIDGTSQIGKDFNHHVVEMFTNPLRVGVYIIAFIFLMLHLLHGFQSAFQSVGLKSKKTTPLFKKLGYIYAVGVPLGFIFIALFHHFTNCH